MDIYLDQSAGNDAAAGTQDAPVASLDRARVLWREDLAGDCTVHIRGAYRVTSPMALVAADQRTGHLIFRGWDGQGVLTGLAGVSGWAESGGLWQATLPVGSLAPMSLRFRGQTIRPASFTDMGLQRVIRWDEVARTVVVPSHAFDAAEAGAPLFIRLLMGWCLTIAKVASFATSGGETAISFDADMTRIEFAKGTPGVHANLSAVSNMPFGFGPYHFPGQAFSIYGAVNYVTKPGEMSYNTTTRLLTVYPLPGVALADFEAEVMRTSGATTAITADGINRLRFFNIDVADLAWSEGLSNYCGYDQGLRFTVAQSGPNWLYSLDAQPGVFQLKKCSDVSFTFCQFARLGHSYVRVDEGVKNIIFRGCRGVETDGQGLHINSTFIGGDNMSDANRIEHVQVLDCDFSVIGKRLAGNGIMAGIVNGLTITHNKISETASAAISLGWGAREGNFVGAIKPQQKCLVAFNRIDRALTEQTDDGAIYTNGSWHSGPSATSTPAFWPQDGIRISANHITNVENSGFDPSGGHSVAIYNDLGSDSTWNQWNQMSNVDYAFQENCTRGNNFTGNRVSDAGTFNRVAWAGYNVLSFDPVSSTYSSTAYRAPVSSADTAAWDGNATYGPFKNKVAWTLIEETFESETPLVYRSASTVAAASNAPIITRSGPRPRYQRFFDSVELP